MNNLNKIFGDLSLIVSKEEAKQIEINSQEKANQFINNLLLLENCVSSSGETIKEEYKQKLKDVLETTLFVYLVYQNLENN